MDANTLNTAANVALDLTVLFTIVGAFATIGLTINAFFLRGIFLDIGSVKVTLAKMSTKSEGQEVRIANNEQSLKDITKDIHDLTQKNRSSIHELRNDVHKKILKHEMILKSMYENKEL